MVNGHSSVALKRVNYAAKPAGTECEITSRPVSRVLSEGFPLRDGHSSGTPIAGRLEQSTRVAGLKTDLAPRFRAHPATPICSCSPWGLPCRRRCRRRGALLPPPFTLTSASRGGLLSVAL